MLGHSSQKKEYSQEFYNDWMNRGMPHSTFVQDFGITSSDGEIYFRRYLALCREKIMPGRYRHFKTGPNGEIYYYVVNGVGPHSERKEVLVSFSPEFGEANVKFFFSPAYMFLEEIERDGYKGLRFTKVV